MVPTPVFAVGETVQTPQGVGTILQTGCELRRGRRVVQGVQVELENERIVTVVATEVQRVAVSPSRNSRSRRSTITPSPRPEELKSKRQSQQLVHPDSSDDEAFEQALQAAAHEYGIDHNHAPAEQDDDNSDDDDRPFQIDHAPTSRATCRRCDQVISKGTLRVSHVPLFRGKPGFRVYRHLACAMFATEIRDCTQVGGWRKLDEDERNQLQARIDQSLQEMEQEQVELQPDELVQASFVGPLRSPPPGLTANLLPFQVEGTSWMYHQEELETIRGGILADEMGMGKTLQTIVTMLDRRPLLQHCDANVKHAPGDEARSSEQALWKRARGDWDHEMKMNNVSTKSQTHKGTRGGTLVICPVIALLQWKSEIEKFADGLTVCVYHGPNRASECPPELLRKYDVVLTTYQVIESDFRKMVSPNKVACPNCGGKFKIDKLRIHLKYFCGEGAKRTEAQARQHRSRERSNPRGGPPPKKKPGMTATQPPRIMSPVKRLIRVKRTGDYSSESDLSVVEEVKPSARRTSRGSKTQTRAKPPNRRKPASDDSDDGDSDFALDDSTDDSASEDDYVGSEAPPVTRRLKSRSSSAAKSSVQKIEESQARAMAAVKKAGTGKKKTVPSKKGKGSQKKRKRFDDGDDSDPDSSDSDDERDPMADIDMDELLDEAMAGARFSPLHSFCWWRIVLDEAHFIKSRSSQTAAAAFALTGIHRWCLSGTPLQNRVGELYSLIRFLRIEPMAHYFCRQKGCNCKSIHYRMKEGRCLDCGHRPFSHYAHFNKYVLNPIQREGYSGDGRRAMFKLKNEVLDKCLLRRTKETRAADMNLPPRIVSIRTIRLHPVEEDFYNALYSQTKASFDDYVAEGTMLNNYAHIFDLLTKMRQAVDHPYLIVHSKKNSEMKRGSSVVANGSVDCDLCDEPFTDRVVSSCCGAGFCRSCVMDYLSSANGDSTPCPSCRSPFSIDLSQESVDVVDDGTLVVDKADKAGPSLKELTHVPTGSILRRINLAEFATSTKIEALVQELIDMRQKRPGSKALVFSQFVNMLDLIRWRLHSDPCLTGLGLGVRILHGGMDVKSRNEALKSFREDGSVRVLLMSLKAGGVALNLTVASEVFLVDNWWNPAAEMQAIDRTHRLGQYRPIRAVRFIAEGTVEERVLQLQEKKRLVFDGTVGRDAGSLQMLTADDMKALFM